MAMEVHLLTNLSAHLNSALNPLFYLIFNPKMKNGYKNLFKKCFKRTLLSKNITMAEISWDSSLKVSFRNPSCNPVGNH